MIALPPLASDELALMPRWRQCRRRGRRPTKGRGIAPTPSPHDFLLVPPENSVLSAVLRADVVLLDAAARVILAA